MVIQKLSLSKAAGPDGNERSQQCRLTVFWVWFRGEKRTVPAVKSDDRVGIRGGLFLIIVPLLKQAGISI